MAVMPLALSSRPVLHPLTVVRQETPDKWLLFYPATRGLHFIRPLGKEIVDLCDGEHTVADVVKAIATRHNLKDEEVEEHVTQFLRNLVMRRVLLVREEEWA